MGLDEYLKKLSFDKRMLDRNLDQKTISSKELEQHLSNLEDVSEYGEVIQMNEEEEESSTDPESE